MSTKRKEAYESASVALETPVAKARLEPAPQATIVEDRSIETSHARIALTQTNGRGLPLLFLHGNSASKDIFAGQIHSALGQDHRLIAMDLPGHGASGDAHDPAETYSIPGYADATIQVLEALDIDQVAIVGWSLGGHIALELMASFPDVVGACIVGTPPIALGVEALQQAFRPHPLMTLLATPDLSEAQIADLASAVVGPDLAPMAAPAIRRTDGRARALMFGSLLNAAFEDERRIVETSAIPLAVVAGADDPFVDTDYLRSLAYANLWSGACRLLPRCGHTPFLDAPQIFNHILSSFAHDMDARAHELRESPQLVFGG